ncbi:hypothetical protein J6590_043808 [Homalodisca vitripennis]|nr:hypothetical protein J6590_043808 [Homalodisca vitripennis]
MYQIANLQDLPIKVSTDASDSDTIPCSTCNSGVAMILPKLQGRLSKASPSVVAIHLPTHVSSLNQDYKKSLTCYVKPVFTHVMSSRRIRARAALPSRQRYCYCPCANIADKLTVLPRISQTELS